MTKWHYVMQTLQWIANNNNNYFRMQTMNKSLKRALFLVYRWTWRPIPWPVWQRYGLHWGHHRSITPVSRNRRRFPRPKWETETERINRHRQGRQEGPRGEEERPGTEGRPLGEGWPGGATDRGGGPRVPAPRDPPQRNGPRAGLPDQGGTDIQILQWSLLRCGDQLRQDSEQSDKQQKVGQGEALSDLLPPDRLRWRPLVLGQQPGVPHSEEAFRPEMWLCVTKRGREWGTNRKRERKSETEHTADVTQKWGSHCKYNDQYRQQDLMSVGRKKKRLSWLGQWWCGCRPVPEQVEW